MKTLAMQCRTIATGCWRRGYRGIRWLAGWIPLTWLSVIALPVLILLFRIYAMQRQDKIVLAICVCSWGLIALQTAVVLATALWLKLRRERAVELLELETGVPKRTGVRLGLMRWNPLIKIEVEWIEPECVTASFVSSGNDIVEEATANDRGRFLRIVRRYRIVDAFGLARFTVRRRMEQSVVIKPNCGRVNGMQLAPQNVPGEQLSDPRGQARGDLVEMRPYAPGDPLKLVLWKQFARSGRLLVRQPEKAVSATQKTLVYLVAADADDPTAGVARALFEQGSLSDFLFSTDGDEQPTREIAEAADRIVRSSAFRQNGGEALGRFLGKGAKQGYSAAVLFVPCRPGPWLERVAGHLAKSSCPCRVIIGIDGAAKDIRQGFLRRCLFHGDYKPAATLAQLRDVCDRLQGAGVDVYVVDRISGNFGMPAMMIG